MSGRWVEASSKAKFSAPYAYMVVGARPANPRFGGLKRAIARDQAQKSAVQTLTTIQEQLEKALGCGRVYTLAARSA